MKDEKPLTGKKMVLAALIKEGQSYKDLQDRIKSRPSVSNLNKILRALEDDGKAVREKVVHGGPGYRVGISVDRIHEPRVLWRLR